MKKRIFSRVLALIMALSLLSTTAFAAVELTTDYIDTDTGALLGYDVEGSESKAYDYYLSGDFTLDKTLVISDGIDANIDLNGHKLQLNEKVTTKDNYDEGYDSYIFWRGGKSGPVIKVTGEDTSLTIMDKVMEEGAEARGEETGIITGSNAGGIAVNNGGEFTLSGGKVTQNVGRGVNVDNATFNMTGGIICDNQQNATGGVGVSNGGTFNMSGGEITHNWSGTVGGGVSVTTGATLNMTGGEITDNRAGRYGGGVFVSDGTFNLSDGEISGNKAVGKRPSGGHLVDEDSSGGGVYVRYDGTVNMTGGKITQNTSFVSGGGVGVDQAKGAGGNFQMSGGEITENEAQSGTVMAVRMGSYTSNGYTISVDEEGNVTITDAEGNHLDVVYDHNGDPIHAGKLPEGTTSLDFNRVLSLYVPSTDNEQPDDPVTPGNEDIPMVDGFAAAPADATTIEDEEIPLAGLVTLAELLEALRQYEGIEDMELPEDFQWADHDYAQAIYWALDEALVIDTEDDPLDPDELVTVAILREVLESFAEYKGLTDFVVTVEGEDDMIVMDLGERLTVFYGELEAALAAKA